MRQKRKGAVQVKTVFVSYSHDDADFVDRLILDLRVSDIPATYDKWLLNVGDSIIEKIAQAVTKAEGVIAILSPNSVQSNWVKKELALAMTSEIERQGIKVFPAVIADCTVPAVLSDKLYADFRKSYYHGLGSLVRALCPEFFKYESGEFIKRATIGRELEQLKDLLSSNDVGAIRAWISSNIQVVSYGFRSELIPSLAVGADVVDFVGLGGCSYEHHLSLIMFGSPTWNRQNPDELVRESERLEGLLRWCRDHEQDMRRKLAIRMNGSHHAAQIVSGEPHSPSYKNKLPMKLFARLVYGRRTEYGTTETRLRKTIYEKSNHAIEIMSYDRILDHIRSWMYR